jgi:hypothetical protein
MKSQDSYFSLGVIKQLLVKIMTTVTILLIRSKKQDNKLERKNKHKQN